MLDGSQMAASGPNRYLPELHLRFAVPLKQPQGNTAFADLSLALLFNSGGPERGRQRPGADPVRRSPVHGTPHGN